MKASGKYFANIIITILLVFSLLAVEGTLFVRLYASKADTCLSVMEEQGLSDRIYTSLETRFTEQVSTSGIPAQVYMDALTREQLDTGVRASVTSAYAYLHGTSDSYAFEMDLSALEASIRQFFSDYADEIQYPKDETYEKKVNAAVDSAKKQVLQTVDVFRFSTLESAGLLSKIRRVMPWLNPAVAASVAVVCVLLGLLAWINRKHPLQILYWSGCSLTVASCIALVPLIYVKATDYFAAFTIKTTQIYAAVTGMLNRMTDACLLLESIMLGFGILCLAAYTIGACRTSRQ